MSDDEEALPHLVSPEAAAALLGVSRATVLLWAAEGDLVGHRSGGHDWFVRSQPGIGRSTWPAPFAWLVHRPCGSLVSRSDRRHPSHP